MNEKQNLIDIKLTVGNYPDWKVKIESLFVLRDLIDIVEEPAPENPLEGDEYSDDENEEEAALLRVRRAWEKRSRQLRAIIELNIDRSNSLRIREVRYGNEAWKLLHDFHHNKTVGNQQRLLQQITSHFKTPSVTMQAHLDELFDLVIRYRDAGGSFEDNELINRIMTSVSSEYDGLIDAIGIQSVGGSGSAGNQDPWVLKQWLIDYDQEKQRRKKREASASTSSAYNATEQGQIAGKAIQQQVIRLPVTTDTERYCNGCRIKGHIRRDCPTNDISIAQLKRIVAYRENKAQAANQGQQYASHVFSRDFVSGQECWIADSGATIHMTPNEKLFIDIDKSHKSSVMVANGKKLNVEGKGSVSIMINSNQDSKVLNLKNVLFVPSLNANLFSIREFTSNGHSVIFDNSKVYLLCDDKKIEIGKIASNHYVLESSNEAKLAEEAPCKHELHRRFAHRNLQDIQHMIALGLPSQPCLCSDVCEDCLKGKMSRRPFKRSTPVEAVLDVVVSDVHGPMPVESIGRNRYFVTYIDVKSRYCELRIIKNKSEVPKCTIEYIEHLKLQYGKKPKVFRSDRGTEYMDKKLQSYLAQEGIWYETTVGYCPEQNGIAERMNRTLGEATITLLSDAKLPKNHWAEAVCYANYCNNRIINKTLQKSPLQMFCNSKPDWSQMRRFGAEVFVLTPQQKRNKLQPKSRKMKFIGFDQHAKGFRVTDGKQVTISREVKFTEDIDKKTKRKRSRQTKREVSNDPEESSCPVGLEYFNDDDAENVIQEVPEMNHENQGESDSEEEWFDAEEGEGSSSSEEEQEEPENAPEPPQQPEPRRSARTNAGKLPARFKDFVLDDVAMLVSVDPKSDREAMASNDAEFWKKAKEEELQAIKRNNTWKTVNLPKNRKAIGSKWVFKSKTDENGERQFKARLVAQGFTQQFGVDYSECFAPVGNAASMRILLTVAGMKGFHVRHYDVKSAFLNGELKEEIFMRPPPGVQENGKVYQLQKSLYGLKQAANVWNQKLHETLVRHGSVRSNEDDCLYTHASGGVIIHLLIHVDDILAATNSPESLMKFMSEIGKEFDLKDLGEAKSYLGIELHRNSEGFYEISQTEYINRALELTGLMNATVQTHPMDVGYHKLTGNPLGTNEDYRKIIGMLLYISINSRPDIAAPVALLCQKVSAPTDTDINEAKRIFRYLKGTRNIRLRMGCSQAEEKLCGYTDSDWAEDQTDRKSNSGFVCFLKGSPITWKSNKQTIVATSSAEAEFIAMSSATKEIAWLRRLVECFDIKQNGPVQLNTDSQAAIAMVVKPKLGARTKHIDTKFHHVKEAVNSGEIELNFVPGENNVADILTKPLGPTKLKRFSMTLGLSSTSRSEEEC